MNIALPVRLLFLSSLLLMVAFPASLRADAVESNARDIFVKAIFSSGEEQIALVESLAETGDPIVEVYLEAWRRSEIFIYTNPEGEKIPLIIQKDELKPDEPPIAYLIATGEPLLDAEGEYFRPDASEMEALRASRRTRFSFSRTLDLVALSYTDPRRRAQAARSLGLKQNPEYLAKLHEVHKEETDKRVLKALDEGIAISTLALGNKDEKLGSIERLKELRSRASISAIKALRRSIENNTADEEYTAAEIAQIDTAIRVIDRYIARIDYVETLFRGLSLGSVLLIVALGLAITFGLMGVINMAHGEMIAVGAYAAFMSQQIFLSVFSSSAFAIQWYFLFAIPFSFIVAALCGLCLERGIIQFLYKRPLESLLATWGVSLILQQAFRLIFGAANRQINSPSWLMGNFQVFDVVMGYNRIFVIGFAAVIVLGTWLLMTRTSLGLCIRAVMQDPQMAAAMGIRTDRVRMATFAFGSGLAGLAGVFLSQIGSVGSNLGQNYIVDSFMVVVAGGVGNIVGTIVSALGIGLVDQALQPFFGPVMGRITVLVMIILFLQWKPGGLFPARSRSLD